MPIQRVGHVVLKMRDLERAKHFYHDILGMKITDEREGAGIFFRFDDYHHDLAVFKVNDDAAAPEQNQVGLAHIALVVESLQEVKNFYHRLKEHGVPIVGTSNHGYTKSVYCSDPEGNQLEIYCEGEDWHDFETMFIGEPLELEN